MSYPGPPGVTKGPQPSSLPPRPPPSKITSGFKPAFSAAPSAYAASAAPSYPATTTYASAPGPSFGAAPTPTRYGAPPSTSSYNAYPQSSSIGAGRGGYSQPQGTYDYSQQQQRSTFLGPTPPQIRNPFPAPNAQGAADYEPEMAAQIAQWQTAYMPKDPAEQVTTKGPGGRPGAVPQAASAPQPVGATEAADGAGIPAEKKQTVYREGGGKKWQDDSLVEWDPAHLRLFVGNLAGEVTDDSLLKAFARWKSVQKAKVVRDKRTTKSRGFGFVSFSDPDDFFQAAKEMNGKYIQSHPVVVHKAKTEIKPQHVRDNNHNRGGKNQKKTKKSGSGGGQGDGGSGYEPQLGPVGGGVTKPGQKTRGGLKLLG